MNAHNYDEMHKLQKALQAELGKIQKLADALMDAESGDDYAKKGAALMERLSSASLYGEVLSTYLNEWAQQMALEVVLDADGFEMVAEALTKGSN